MFRKGRGKSKRDAAVTEEQQAPEPQAPARGPHDESEAPDSGVERLDLGSVRVPVPEGGQLQVEVDPAGPVRAVHLVTPVGRLTVSAFAAPRSGGLWEEVRNELAEQLRKDGARVHTEQGDWGVELVADSPKAALRFVGVDVQRHAAVGAVHDVLDRRCGRDEAEAELALEALAHDLHVQEPEEPAAEAEAQGLRGLRLVEERGVVELELLERVPQLRVLVGVRREEPREHHGLDVLVAGKRCGRRPTHRGQRVAHPEPRDVLQPGHEADPVEIGAILGPVLDVADVTEQPCRNPVPLARRSDCQRAVADPDLADDREPADAGEVRPRARRSVERGGRRDEAQVPALGTLAYDAWPLRVFRNTHQEGEFRRGGNPQRQVQTRP